MRALVDIRPLSDSLQGVVWAYSRSWTRSTDYDEYLPYTFTYLYYLVILITRGGPANRAAAAILLVTSRL